MTIIEFPGKLLQGKDLFIIFRAPAKKRYKIHNRLRQKALFHQILIGGMAAAFGKLMMLLIRNQRTVHIYRHLPPKRFIKPVIFGRGGKVLVSSHHMGDSHEMIIHNVSKIIGGISVGFDEDHVIQLRIVHGDVPVNFIMEGCGSLGGVILTDNIGHTRRQLFFHFLTGQAETVLIIYIDLFPCHRTGQCSQSLFITEAVISFSFFHQFPGIFQIDSLRLALTLDVRADTAVLIRAFIMLKACFFQSPVNDLHGPLHETFLIRVLNPKNEISTFMLGNQIGV